MCRFVFDSAMPTPRLVRQIADRAQIATQRSWKRPYGVGLLVAGADPAGARLFYNCPSGNFYDYKAFAIGARSQVRPGCAVLFAMAARAVLPAVVFLQHLALKPVP